ncbi:MAG TPA: DUF2243 domain-containing protein [Natronosporangium sp.]
MAGRGGRAVLVVGQVAPGGRGAAVDHAGGRAAARLRGAFNLVEGVVDHHLLAVHHVRYGPGQAAYDVGFLLSGVVLVLAGVLLYRAGRRAATTRPAGDR